MHGYSYLFLDCKLLKIAELYKLELSKLMF